MQVETIERRNEVSERRIMCFMSSRWKISEARVVNVRVDIVEEE